MDIGTIVGVFLLAIGLISSIVPILEKEQKASKVKYLADFVIMDNSYIRFVYAIRNKYAGSEEINLQDIETFDLIIRANNLMTNENDDYTLSLLINIVKKNGENHSIKNNLKFNFSNFGLFKKDKKFVVINAILRNRNQIPNFNLQLRGDDFGMLDKIRSFLYSKNYM